MNKTYLITLTPTGKFFFGGDMAFTVNNKETEYTSYIIRSNKFPQQTSLLGMLRFLILRNDKDIFDTERQEIIEAKKDEATRLIGPRSFQISGEKNDFGVIKALHPCFLQIKKDEKWIDLTIKPKDLQFKVSFPNDCPSAVLNGKIVDIPISDYQAKNYYRPIYQATKTKEEVEEKKIFIESVSNGIDRDIHTGKTDDNSLFKTISYRLKENCRFAFYAEIDMDKVVDYDGQLVSVGGDNSQFVVGIEEANRFENDVRAKNRIVLSSPAYLTKEDLSKVKFAITETIPFKCMKTMTSSVKGYNKKSFLYDYSEKITLYTTGSIFYLNQNDMADFIAKLEDHKDFYQIGYNHYHF